MDKIQMLAMIQGYTAVGIGLIIGVGLAMFFAFANPLLGVVTQ